MIGIRRYRASIAVQGIAATVAVWTVLVSVALFHHGTHWPRSRPAIPGMMPGQSTTEAWADFLLIAAIVEFLLLKSWAMARRTRKFDSLGLSLIAANVAFALVYLYVMAAQLFRWAPMPWQSWLLIRLPLIAVVGWGAVEICRVRDPRRTGVGVDDRVVYQGPNRRGRVPGRRAGDRT